MLYYSAMVKNRYQNIEIQDYRSCNFLSNFFSLYQKKTLVANLVRSLNHPQVWMGFELLSVMLCMAQRVVPVAGFNVIGVA